MAFASELKALTILPGFDHSVDATSVADFLALSYVPDPRTIFRKVRKLPPATTLLLSDTGQRMRRYWQLGYSESAANLPAVMEQIDSLSEDSVTRRMLSDVPLGAFLSGGVDSSAIVAYMSRRASNEIKTFSIGFTSKAFDETRYARLMVDRYKTTHQEEMPPDILEMLDVLVNHFDEPFGDSSAIPTLYLSRMTRRHVTVALSGDGADEMFGGAIGATATVSSRPDYARASQLGSGSRFCAAGRYDPKLDFMPQVFRRQDAAGQPQPRPWRCVLHLNDGLPRSGTGGDSSPDCAPAWPAMILAISTANCSCATRNCHRCSRCRQSTWRPIYRATSSSKVGLGDDGVLAGGARALAGSSNRRTGRLAAGILEDPGALRQAYLQEDSELLVPGEILYRRKMGFSVPLAEWFRSSLKPVFEATVLSAKSAQWIDGGEARRLWNEHQSGLHNRDRALWNLLMLWALG